MAKIRWVTDAILGERWTLGEQLADPYSATLLTHVRRVSDREGVEGVAKIPRRQGDVQKIRLINEITSMNQLRGRPGVLEMLDSSVDDLWMVTEKAQLLSDHLGPDPDLRDVVEVFQWLAQTLASMHDEGVTHRDLKPANLFWTRDQALLGDFGLVSFPGADSVTASGIPVGSVNFIAPEAREAHGRIDWRACDVYAWAASLWAIASGVRFPPLGTLFARDADNSLHRHGGKPADALAGLIEACTASRPYRRPSMALVAEELEYWKRVWPEAPRPARPSSRPHRVSFLGEGYEARIHAGGIEMMARACLNDLARLVAEELHVANRNPVEDAALTLLAQADLGRGNPDWEPEWPVVMAGRAWPVASDSRLVLGLVGDTDDSGYYLCEWQISEHSTDAGLDASDGTWKLHWNANPIIAILRWPSDWACKAALAHALAQNAPAGLHLMSHEK